MRPLRSRLISLLCRTQSSCSMLLISELHQTNGSQRVLPKACCLTSRTQSNRSPGFLILQASGDSVDILCGVLKIYCFGTMLQSRWYAYRLRVDICCSTSKSASFIRPLSPAAISLTRPREGPECFQQRMNSTTISKQPSIISH